jgi:flagellar hook assembly protein FlgD
VRNFALHQNYPNPFSAAGNNATAIRYRLNSNAAVYLSIYDMLGREIKTLARLIEPAGEHVAVWDGFNSAGEPAPSGIYFYRLQIEKSTEVKKLVLTR